MLGLLLAATFVVGASPFSANDPVLCKIGEVVVRQQVDGFRYLLWDDEPLVSTPGQLSFRGLQGGAYCSRGNATTAAAAAVAAAAAAVPLPAEAATCCSNNPCGRPALLFRTRHLYYLRVALLALPLWSAGTQTIAAQWEAAAAKVFSGSRAELRGQLAMLSPMRAVVVGGGMGVYASTLARYFPAASVVSVEKSKAVIDASRLCFDMRTAATKRRRRRTTTTRAGGSRRLQTPGLHVVQGDGRIYVTRKVPDASADLLFLDAFTPHNDATPASLRADAFGHLAWRKLRRGGVLIVNDIAPKGGAAKVVGGAESAPAFSSSSSSSSSTTSTSAFCRLARTWKGRLYRIPVPRFGSGGAATAEDRGVTEQAIILAQRCSANQLPPEGLDLLSSSSSSSPPTGATLRWRSRWRNNKRKNDGEAVPACPGPLLTNYSLFLNDPVLRRMRAHGIFQVRKNYEPTVDRIEALEATNQPQERRCR